VVDGAGRLKPAWYAVRAAYADRLVAVVRQDGGLELAAVNDRPESWLTTVAVRRVSVDGTVLAEQTLTLDVAARSGARIPLDGPVVAVDDARRELLVVEANGLRAIEPFAEDVDASWEPPLLDVHAARTRDGWNVQVRSDRFVRDLALLVDRISPDAEVDEMLVTLLPGESVTFHVTGAAGADPLDFGDPLVLRSAHQLVSGRVMTARTGLDPAGEPALPAG
jgi:beta-mannosidase